VLMEIAAPASSPLDPKRGPRVVAGMGDEETGLERPALGSNRIGIPESARF
jgi:hypothetical protein